MTDYKKIIDELDDCYNDGKLCHSTAGFFMYDHADTIRWLLKKQLDKSK